MHNESDNDRPKKIASRIDFKSSLDFFEISPPGDTWKQKIKYAALNKPAEKTIT